MELTLPSFGYHGHNDIEGNEMADKAEKHTLTSNPKLISQSKKKWQYHWLLRRRTKLREIKNTINECRMAKSKTQQKRKNIN